MNPEDSLTEGLRALADATRGEEAPAHLETVLLEAFEEHKQTKPAKMPARRLESRPTWVFAMVAAAVVMALVTVVVSRRRPAPVVRHQNAAPVVVKSPSPLIPAGKKLLSQKRKRRARHKKASSVAEEEVATSFIPLPYAEVSAAETGRIVRVTLPRSALVTFGLPMNPERAFEPVRADVFYGEDGVARAIRFVQ